MDVKGWGFHEEADWEDDEPPARRRPPQEAPNGLVGEDVAKAVKVTVTANAEIVAVELARNWKNLVDPLTLSTHVREAANNAGLRAMAAHAGEAEPRVAARPAHTSNVPRLNKTDVQRLLSAVTTELAQFTARLSAADQPTSVRSGGGHVTAIGKGGQVLELSIEQKWVLISPVGEIQSEVLDALQVLRRASVPADLVNGPQGPATAELVALASDPQKLLRSVGLLRADKGDS